MVLIYDPATGHVVHGHQVVTQKGGQHPDDKALEQQALEHAARRSQPVDLKQTAFLHIDPNDVKQNKYYRVDPAKRALVEIAPPR
jgi:hypothetical protein